MDNRVSSHVETDGIARRASTSFPEWKLDDPRLYVNRELSWLAFNNRVVEEACDPTVPLLERLKFLAIADSNLDEFFMVRVGGLQQKQQGNIVFGSGADRTPVVQQLEAIHAMAARMSRVMQSCLWDEIMPRLAGEGIVIRRPEELTAEERQKLKEQFRGQVFQVLTPLAIDPVHPFPLLLNKSLNLGVLLRRPDGERLHAVVQVPAVLPRFVALPAATDGPRHAFLPLEDLIRTHLPELFPGMTIEHAAAFRVTRDSDLEFDDDEVEDLLKAVEEQIRKRKKGMAVRVQLESRAPAELEQFLIDRMDLDSTDIFRVEGMIDMTGLFQIHGLPEYQHLRDRPFTPQHSAQIQNSPNIFAAIRQGDILLHHPYESFSHVVDFIEAAATDERVLAIKQTLYRTSSDSPVVRALQRAADNGKQVTAVVEIKARLDEERNIVWARELEKVGVHVVYGFVNLKTHCKAALVVRREEDGIRRYVHLATGNYNPQTARIYTDLGYFTCREEFCEDVSHLFNYLTGYCEPPQWRKLIVAPSHLQPFMLERIEREILNASQGKPSGIKAKINGLLEPAIVQALYRASRAGVKTEVVCRGICALRPGIAGVSDNISVRSVVDRFLEHSRVYCFENAGSPEVYIGSADWMDRNLSRRVEVVFPIEAPALRLRLINEILQVSLDDNVKAREMLSDGSYRRVAPAAGQKPIRSQECFLGLADARNAVVQEHAASGKSRQPKVAKAPRKPRT
ncbi:MAG: polyphosphate kinase 1 [Planctomycetes bacterium]|nr:polyphosphate kinase 1 [Planctomycetota bacterium]